MVTKINPSNCHGLRSFAFVQADLIAYAGVETFLASSAGGEKERELGRRKSAGDERVPSEETRGAKICDW